MHRLAAVSCTVGWLLAGAPAQAQVADAAAHRAGIDQLDFLVGRWHGEAWRQVGAERKRTTMTETVERKLGGTVLQVEGIGLSADGDSTPPQVVHHALAIVSYDPASGRHVMRSYLASGHFGDFTLTLVPGGVSWSREVPGGRVRNTARLTRDTWHEVGEFSRDGVNWIQVLEMNLRRAP